MEKEEDGVGRGGGEEGANGERGRKGGRWGRWGKRNRKAMEQPTHICRRETKTDASTSMSL